MLFPLIPTRVHAALDYFTALAIPILPRALGLGRDMTRYHDTLAATTLAYSAATDYELGLVRKLPMRAHLAFDVVGGLTLLSTAALARDESPRARTLLTTLGLVYLAVPLLSDPLPASRRHPTPQPTPELDRLRKCGVPTAPSSTPPEPLASRLDL